MVLGPGFSVIIDGVLFIHEVKEEPPLTPIDIRGCTTTPAVDSEEELAAEIASIVKKVKLLQSINLLLLIYGILHAHFSSQLPF